MVKVTLFPNDGTDNKNRYRVLLTCPPMIRRIQNDSDLYEKKMVEYNIQLAIPEVQQIMAESELIQIIGDYDAWIVGDDNANREVLKAGKSGSLRSVIKWGVGIDNIDQEAIQDLGLKFDYTPAMFGKEVADVAIGYILGLARDLFKIDRAVREGHWYKPTGISLTGKKVVLLGFGDIGRQIARRLVPFDVNLYISDPGFQKLIDPMGNSVISCLYDSQITVDQYLAESIKEIGSLENIMIDADFLIVCCNLNTSTYHLIDEKILSLGKWGLRLVNISRGPVIKEDDLIRALQSGQVYGAALDVFEVEPLEFESPLLTYPNNIFGSHNGSNTVEAVNKTSFLVLDKLNKLLQN